MSKAVLVRNPASGGADDWDDAISEALRPFGDLLVCESSDDGTFPDRIREAVAGATTVIVAGGDGTLNVVINELEQHLEDLEFVVIPMGTGNDFARTLGLPADATDAAKTAAEGRTVPVDVWVAEGSGVRRLFVNACIGGFPVEVDEAVSDDLKARIGPFAYWVAGAKAARDLDTWDVTVNGRQVPSTVAVGVGNGRTCGGGVEVWPEADPGDGSLEACALPADGVMEAIKLAAKVKGGTHQEMPEVICLGASEVEIEAEPSLELNVDGELVGLRTPATFKRFKQTRFRVPGG